MEPFKICGNPESSSKVSDGPVVFDATSGFLLVGSLLSVFLLSEIMLFKFSRASPSRWLTSVEDSELRDISLVLKLHRERLTVSQEKDFPSAQSCSS